MKLNANKTQSMIVSRSRTVYPNHRDLFINNVVLTTCGSFKILGVPFDSKFTFEQHLSLHLLLKRLVCLGNHIKFLVTLLF